MKRIFHGRIFILLTAVICIVIIIATYHYRKTEKSLIYNSSQASTTSLALLSNNISDEDWQKLLTRVNENHYIAASTTLTESDVMSREVFAQFILAKQQGKNITKDQANSIATDLLTYANSVDEKITLYKKTDLRVINNPTTGDLLDYRDSFKAVLEKNRDQIGQELNIMQDAVQNNNFENIEKLKSMAVSYNNMAAAMIKMKTPAYLVDYQLSIANSYLQIAKNVRSFTHLATDPLIAAKNFNEYTIATVSLFPSFGNIKAYLSLQGVKY